MHQEEEKELVRMEKQVKELFEKSKRVYPLDPPKEVPKKKAKEEDVTEEREASPTLSSGSWKIMETEEVKGLQDWRSRQPEDMFHNAPWLQGQGKGYGGKRDERELLSFGSTGSEPDIQGFHKHVAVNFDTGAAVSTDPRWKLRKRGTPHHQV